MSATTTATVMFTDVVASTELRVELGEERADRLRREHDGVVSTQVARHEGEVVKGSGDGLLAAFRSAADALTAAVAIQRAVDAYGRRPDAVAAFQVRVGVSAGDVVFEDGDCFGTPVVEAARLVAACDGGQILCSEIVRMLARGRGGHELRSIGFLDLKGLPEPVAAWEVEWRDTAGEIDLPLPAEIALELERPMVGRSEELAGAVGLVVDPDRRRAAVVWISGEPGIGKTRLASAVAHEAHESGALVLYGRCNEDLPVPYQPFVEALRGFLATASDDTLASRLGSLPGELSRLVPELAQRIPGLPPPAEGSGETGQWRLFNAVQSWLATASSGRPVVVVVDDVHWATSQTLQLVGHVARSAEPSRVALVLTARNTAPDETSEVRDLIDDLAVKVPSCRRLELAGLDPSAVAELVGLARLPDAADPATAALHAARLHRETAGNPLYIASLLAAGSADVPRDLAGAVRRRVSRLPEHAIALLRTAAVVGLDVDVRVLAAAAGVDDDAAIDAMELAAAAGLVHAGGADGYRFTHALVRATLRQEVGDVRLPRVHARVARAILAVHGSRLEDRTEAAAYHFSEAARAGLEVEEALHWAVSAGERAERLGSYPEAVRHFGRALDLLAERSTDDYDPGRLLVARGIAQRRAGSTAAALASFTAAAEHARAAGDADVFARAAIAFEDTTWRPAILGRESVALVEEAIERLGAGDDDLHLLLRASHVRARYFAFGELSDSAADEVTDLARRMGPETLAAVMARTNWRHSRHHTVEGTDAALRFFEEWRDAARRAHDADLMIESTHSGLAYLAESADMDGYHRRLADMEAHLREHPIPFWQYTVLNHRQWQAFFAGDLAEAERLADDCLELGESFHGEDPSGIHGLRMFLIRREQDRLAELAPLVRTILRMNPAAAMWRPGLTALLAESGLVDEARDHLAELCRGDAVDVADDALWVVSMSFLADACRALGDAGRADTLYQLLLPHQGRNLLVAVFIACLGAADRILGVLAATTGRLDDAASHLEHGLALNRAMGTSLWEAHSAYELARVLLERRGPGDVDRAATLVGQAAALAERHGLVALSRKAAALRARAL